jgi:hypothetical protein
VIQPATNGFDGQTQEEELESKIEAEEKGEIMKVSKELDDVLRQASAEVDAWPKWKRSLDPIGLGHRRLPKTGKPYTKRTQMEEGITWRRSSPSASTSKRATLK